jgi:hypothetical protein
MELGANETNMLEQISRDEEELEERVFGVGDTCEYFEGTRVRGYRAIHDVYKVTEVVGGGRYLIARVGQGRGRSRLANWRNMTLQGTFMVRGSVDNSNGERRSTRNVEKSIKNKVKTHIQGQAKFLKELVQDRIELTQEKDALRQETAELREDIFQEREKGTKEKERAVIAALRKRKMQEDKNMEVVNKKVNNLVRDVSAEKRRRQMEETRAVELHLAAEELREKAKVKHHRSFSLHFSPSLVRT